MRNLLAAALVLALSSGAAAGDDAGVRRAVEDAVSRGDRPAALALLDAVTAPEAPRERRRSVEAARAAMDVVGGPDGDVRAARILLDTLASDRSDREGAWSLAVGLRARALRRETDLASARELLAGLARIYPETIDYAKDLALVYRDAGLADEARAEYARIIELAPSFTEARYRLAALEEERGGFDEALAVYDDLIRLHDKDRRPELRAHWSKGWLLLEKVHDCAAARRALDAGAAAAAAAGPGPERDEYLAKFEALRGAVLSEERHRAALRELRARLDRVLACVGTAWALVLGGGVVLLRRARLI